MKKEKSFYLVRYCILLTSSWLSGIPSSIVVRRCAANLTPATPSGSSPCINGWEQHVFVHMEGNVILLSDLCCNNNSPFSLNIKSEKALCKGEVPSASNSWHSRLLAWPMLRVFTSCFMNCHSRSRFLTKIRAPSLASRLGNACHSLCDMSHNKISYLILHH